MTADPAAAPPAPPAGDAEGKRIKSIDDLAAEQQRQGSILERLETFLGSGETPPAAPKADAERPEVNVAEEIRRQLEERDKAKPKEPAATLPDPKELAEKVPKPVVRKIEKFMGWAEP